MLADLYKDEVQVPALKKILNLLDGYEPSSDNAVVYEHIEQILRVIQCEQREKEQALCGMVRMMLDAFSTHIESDSDLRSHIKILQARLTPPLTLAEITALNNYI